MLSEFDAYDIPTNSLPIRVLLADDHDILRQGLKLLLETQPDIQVVGEACTGIEAIEQTDKHTPDVVVMDISMAHMDGLEASRQIRARQPETQVLILTMHESEEYFLQALRMGAAGYLVKKAAPADLCAAVRTIAHGGAFLYPGLAKSLIRAYLAPSNMTTAADRKYPDETKHAAPIPPLDVLTPREMEVLKMVAEGYTNQEIADRLVLSIKTVQAHRANVMEKLGLHDITQLVRFALLHRLIPPEP
ncbi:MAG TPA: response regulator transcription factor [Ktedonobacteraceae bacterium]|nr:response regulator transcription factor [Ktedonobacteraceae bacterium]